jgi:hypothetical protein
MMSGGRVLILIANLVSHCRPGSSLKVKSALQSSRHPDLAIGALAVKK